MTRQDALARSTTGKAPVRTAALVVGAIFIVVGILGFIPGITTDYDTMAMAGHESEAKLLGVFQVSVLHNVVHLLLGIAGVLMSRTVSGARTYLIGGGTIYALLFLYGLIVDHESTANFVPLNTADNWLHLILAVGMILLGVLLPPRRRDGVGSTAPMNR